MYNAYATTADRTVAETTFSSLATAKTWARANVTDAVMVTIIDADFPSRHIKLFKLNGKNSWTGNAPDRWFA